MKDKAIGSAWGNSAFYNFLKSNNNYLWKPKFWQGFSLLSQ